MSLTRKRVRDLADGSLSFRRIETTTLAEALEAALRVVDAIAGAYDESPMDLSMSELLEEVSVNSRG